MNRYADTASHFFASILTKNGLLAMTVVLNVNGVSAADTGVAATNLQNFEYWQSSNSQIMEEFVDVPIPLGFQVLDTELEGPVFADANGRTLYKWPLRNLRNGSTGDRKDGNKSVCTDEVLKVTSGLMSPYPPGLVLPNLDKRPSCIDIWPPVLAAEGSEPIGKWTLVERIDGISQWTFDGYPLYFSILDQQPGDVLGGTKIQAGSGSPAIRVPVGPPPAHPPLFQVVPMNTGRMIVTEDRYSVYSYEGDELNKSNCYDSCLDNWTPVLASASAVEQGKWTVIERSPGVRQWAFWGKPLYNYNLDTLGVSRIGSDVTGWHNVYTQRSLAPPSENFSVQAARLGHVLADVNGKTIYVYNCGDDAYDQLACDNPDTDQEYRLAICGAGDPKVCRDTFPYVIAPDNATSESRLWSTKRIDPNTGHSASQEQADGINVWAYRASPVFTFAGDTEPGDATGDAFGEFNGYRNGFKAFWLRDDYLTNAYRR
jgi:predicted lipoprotein with Yx(FWY)xxD motif